MITGILGLIPLLASWCGCFWLSRELAARQKIRSDWRLSWLLACVGWGTLLTLVVEVSSRLRGLNATTMMGAWIFLCLALGSFAANLTWKRGRLSCVSLRAILKSFSLSTQYQPPLDVKLMVWFGAGLMLLLGVVAFVLPNTNWDSLTYHLPRVMHWIQQGSVEHYPTGNTRQIEFAPWAGFVIATLHLLQGSDQSANLVQWFAMLTSVLGATLIARQLLEMCVSRAGIEAANPGVGKVLHHQVNALTALLVVTLPIGAVEATTTQTDYVVTSWLICFTSLALQLVKEPANLVYTIATGLALALGVLTKATMYLYAAPLALALTIYLLLRLRTSRSRWRFGLIFCLTFALLNAGHLSRNNRWFGSPLGSQHILAIERNRQISVGGTLSNVIRNLLLQTNTGIEPVTKSVNALLGSLHGVTGKDPNDPDTTYYVGPFVFMDRWMVMDSYASGPIHLLLVFGVGLFLVLRARSHLPLVVYGSGFAISFLLFCALLRWQQWHGRVHLAYFVLLMPVVAVVLATRAARWAVALSAVALAGFVMLSLITNRSRPLLDLNFAAMPRDYQCLKPLAGHLYEPLTQICDDLVASRCQSVGLKLNFDDAEYPIWLMLRNRGFTGRIEHLRVENESARIPTRGDLPDAVISIPAPQSPPLTAQFPYQTEYGLFNVFWSEPMSRWTQLTRFDHASAQSRLMTATDTELKFSHRLVTFYHRAARAGTLKLTGNITDARGVAVRDNSLRVTTDTGEASLPLDGHPVTIELAIPPPSSAIKLAVIEPLPSGGEIQLRDLRWSWQLNPEK